MKHRTPLEYTLMCLMARAPRTCAQLLRTLQEFPLGGHGQSPGAVYPAVRRLETAGLVCSWNKPRREWRAGYREMLRGRPYRRLKLYGLTDAGLGQLKRWAVVPVTRADLLARPDYLLLRFFFLPGLCGPAGLPTFLQQYAAVADALSDEVERELAEFGADASFTGRRTLELSLALYKTRREWARGAIRDLVPS